MDYHGTQRYGESIRHNMNVCLEMIVFAGLLLADSFANGPVKALGICCFEFIDPLFLMLVEFIFDG